MPRWMLDAFARLDPVTQAFLAGIFTWGVTLLGAGLVFFTRDVGRRPLDLMLGFAGGVMLAASYWSLLAPAIEHADGWRIPAWLPAAVGFTLGGLFIASLDKILPHMHPGNVSPEGPPSPWRRSTLLVSAITLHNIPEGLAIGVAFGAAAAGIPSATLGGAIALAVGIALQNFPEGIAVAMPLRRDGVSSMRAFGAGQASAIVEPFAAALGAAALVYATPLLPYALGFAAGAMVFVVIEELVPEFQSGGNADLGTLGLLAGFVVMMALDVGFS